MSMTKQEIAKVIADNAGITLAAAFKAINTVTDLLVDEVKTKGRFVLAGVGVFTRTERVAHTGRDPRTGEPIQVPEKKAVKFKAAASFKQAVNG
jgi:DNA-binding protein HU-beta